MEKTLKIEFENLVNESNTLIRSYFKDSNASIFYLIEQGYGNEVQSLFKDQSLEYCIRGSLAYGLMDSISDIDILMSVNSLDYVKDKLKNLKVNFIEKAYPEEQKIFGRFPVIELNTGSFQGHVVEIMCEETPLIEQSRTIHTIYLKKVYKNNPMLYNSMKKIKNLAIQGYYDGYYKVSVLVFEKQMKEDLGFVPKRIETTQRGLTYPMWKGKIDPINWIYLRECYGLDEAVKIAKQILT